MTIDVAHEARARRWTLRDEGEQDVLDGSSLISLPAASDGLRIGSGAPLRVATLAAAEPDLIASARRVLLAAAAEPVETLTTTDGRSFGERAAALREARPDAVLVVAGEPVSADALVDLCEALRFGCADQRPQPRVLVSGDARTALRLHQVLRELPIEVLSDPRRDDGHAALVGRARALRRLTDTALVLRDEALEALARAIAHDTGDPTLVVDVSGSSTSLVRAEPTGALLAGHLVPLGCGRGADRVVARAGLDRVRRWIPWAVDAPTLLERVFNRARWPDAVPAERLALALEIALAHEAVRHVLEDLQAAGISHEHLRATPLIVLTGMLAELPRAAQSVLIVANALQPTVVTSLLRDQDDALVALGAAAARSGGLRIRDALAAARQPIAAIAPVSAEGKGSLHVSGGVSVARQDKIARGAFFAVASNGPLEVSVSGGAVRRLTAGACGLVIDARGHPLELPPRDAERVPAVARWFSSLEALP
ncbi:MAG: glutamate mutase L [Chloroflexi bacterium]|nr:glutamate mutase L [Chloroflexota bacterium]